MLTYVRYHWSGMTRCLSSLEPTALGELLYNGIPMDLMSVHRWSANQHFHTSALKPLSQLNSNLVCRLLKVWGQKFVQMVQGHMTKMSASPIYELIFSKRYNLACSPMEDLDKPAHTCSLIRVFDGCSIGSQKFTFHQAEKQGL